MTLDALDRRLEEALIRQAQARAKLGQAKVELTEATTHEITEAERKAALALLSLEQTRAAVELEIRQSAEQATKPTEAQIKARVIQDTRVQQAELISLEAEFTARRVKGGATSKAVACHKEVISKQEQMDLAASEVETVRVRIALVAVK